MKRTEHKKNQKVEISEVNEVEAVGRRLGERIRLARIRRKIRQQDLAGMTGLSRTSIQSIERGDATCSIGGVLNVLWVLGLAAEVDLIADPGLDRDGLSFSILADKKRVFVRKVLDNDF